MNPMNGVAGVNGHKAGPNGLPTSSQPEAPTVVDVGNLMMIASEQSPLTRLTGTQPKSVRR